jgi:acyl carrier protein
MTADRVTADVQAIVRRIAGAHRTPPDASLSTPLAEGGYWLDSIELLEVIMACDGELGPFSPPLEETPDVLDTVGTLVAAIRTRQDA